MWARTGMRAFVGGATRHWDKPLARRSHRTNLPAPFLKRLVLKGAQAQLPQGYPFTLPWLTDDFDLNFETPVTIFCGENGTGKSTLIEAIASLAGFPGPGGGAWAGRVDGMKDAGDPRALGAMLRAAWLPKMSRGWFLRASSFESVAGIMACDHLSVSHGEGFLDLIADRMTGQGLFVLDEPEAALSPRHEAMLLGFLAEIQASGEAQVILATHSPILMAVPGARLLHMSHRGIEPVNFRDTDHFRLYQSFAVDPEDFIAHAVRGDLDVLI